VKRSPRSKEGEEEEGAVVKGGVAGGEAGGEISTPLLLRWLQFGLARYLFL
jgi:hypothetical protein